MSGKIKAVLTASLFFAGMGCAVVLTPSAGARQGCPGNSCHASTTQTTSTTSTTTTPTTTATTTPTTTTTTTRTTTTTPTTTTTTTAAAPAPRPIYWGAYMDGNDTYGSSYGDAPWDTTTWNLFQSHAGKKVSIVHWGVPAPWTSSFNTQLTAHNAVLAAGDVSLLDMNSGSVALKAIASGQYDSYITTWAQQAKAFAHPFFLRWDWEMNGRWFSWGTTSTNVNTAADYVAAWRHMHDIFTSVGATNVTWVWCPNAQFSGSTPLSSLYPGDAYVDWTCIDAYNKGGTGWTSFTDLFASTYDSLLQLAPSKPVMVGETSSTETGGSKATWIANAMAALPTRFPQVRALVWMNWNIPESGTTYPWQIESSSSSQAAFASAVSASYFLAGGGLGSLPLLSSIKAP